MPSDFSIKKPRGQTKYRPSSSRPRGRTDQSKGPKSIESESNPVHTRTRTSSTSTESDPAGHKPFDDFPLDNNQRPQALPSNFVTTPPLTPRSTFNHTPIVYEEEGWEDSQLSPVDYIKQLEVGNPEIVNFLALPKVFRLSPLGYEYFINEIKSDTDLFGFFEDKVGHTYYPDTKQLEIKMGSGKHNKPTHLAANYLETVGKNLTQDIPGFSEDWYVVLDKNTRVWDAKQDSRLWEQKQARKSFAKKVEALMREGKPMSDKAQALERERIDAIYASDEKPSGPAPQADAEVGLHSARHPSFMIETAFGQSAQRARQKATTWLMRTRHSVKYVMVLHLTYDRKPNGGPSDDLSASVKVYKLHLIQQGRTLRQRVVVHSEQRICSRDGRYIGGETNCLNLPLYDVLPRICIDEFSDDVIVKLRSRFLTIPSQKMYDWIEEGNKLQLRDRDQSGKDEITSNEVDEVVEEYSQSQDTTDQSSPDKTDEDQANRMDEDYHQRSSAATSFGSSN